jgi:hypothetical protein
VLASFSLATPTADTFCSTVGVTRCNATDKKSLDTCQSTKQWKTTACASGQACALVNNKAACQVIACSPLNGQRCSTDKAGIETCGSDGRWKQTSCNPDWTCSNANNKVTCVAPPPPPPCGPVDSVRCALDGKGTEMCGKDGKWAPKACPTGQSCALNAGKASCVAPPPPAGCKPGDIQCSADKSAIRYCGMDGNWIDEKCEGGTCDIQDGMPFCTRGSF